MTKLLTVAHLTFYEARRRRIVLAAALCGLLFLALYGLGLFFAWREASDLPAVRRQLNAIVFSILGMFAVNFLSVLFAVLLPVDALSGEIDSGVIQTLASKPIRRADLVLGKWLGHGAIVIGYFLMLVGGVLILLWAITGYVPSRMAYVIPLMTLEVALLLSFTIAGGTRLGTVTNGVVSLGFYGMAFIGGWVEQVGAFAGLASAQTVGIVVSLFSPADALWRLALYHLQPALIRNLNAAGPFTLASVPSALMIWWAAGFTILTMVFAVRSFRRRAL